ncbi:MAG: CRISPR-associated endonuclease Cas1 [Armatimonadota bacterium]
MSLFFGSVNLTTPMIQYCLRTKRPVAFFTRPCRFLGTLQPIMGKKNPIWVYQVKIIENFWFSTHFVKILACTKFSMKQSIYRQADSVAKCFREENPKYIFHFYK